MQNEDTPTLQPEAKRRKRASSNPLLRIEAPEAIETEATRVIRNDSKIKRAAAKLHKALAAALRAGVVVATVMTPLILRFTSFVLLRIFMFFGWAHEAYPNMMDRLFYRSLVIGAVVMQYYYETGLYDYAVSAFDVAVRLKDAALEKLLPIRDVHDGYQFEEALRQDQENERLWRASIRVKPMGIQRRKNEAAWLPPPAQPMDYFPPYERITYVMPNGFVCHDGFCWKPSSNFEMGRNLNSAKQVFVEVDHHISGGSSAIAGFVSTVSGTVLLMGGVAALSAMRRNLREKPAVPPPPVPVTAEFATDPKRSLSAREEREHRERIARKNAAAPKVAYRHSAETLAMLEEARLYGIRPSNVKIEPDSD